MRELKCLSCQLVGYCHRVVTIVATDDEIKDGEFIKAVRDTAFDQQISNRGWVDALCNWLRDYPGCFKDEYGRLIDLDMSYFEYPDGEEKDDVAYARWFHDFCNTPCPPGSRTFVRKEARERVRIVATLLRATYPVRAQTWGQIPANDNRAPNRKK